MATEARPTMSEVRRPKASAASMLRPWSSVPSGKALLPSAAHIGGVKASSTDVEARLKGSGAKSGTMKAKAASRMPTKAAAVGAGRALRGLEKPHHRRRAGRRAGGRDGAHALRLSTRGSISG